MIKYKDIELKTRMDELTIKEYETICHILNDTKRNQIDKYIDIIIVCGMNDERILSEMTTGELTQFLDEFGADDKGKYQPILEFELNGRTYKTHDDKYTFLAKDLAHIQNSIKKHGDKYLCDLMAAVYKDESLTFREHHDPAHLRHKAALFSELPAYYVIPYLNHFVQYVTGEFKKSERDEVDEILKEINEYNKHTK